MMFFKRTPKLDLNRFDTLIAAGTRIEGGTFYYTDTLKVDGTIIASLLESKGDLKEDTTVVILSRHGVITSPELTADIVYVAGTVNGNITAKYKLIVADTGVVNGNAKYSEVEIAAGGRINGGLEHREWTRHAGLPEPTYSPQMPEVPEPKAS